MPTITLEQVSCVVCGGQRFRFLRKADNVHLQGLPIAADAQESSVSECRDCSLVLLNPRRDHDGLLQLNEDIQKAKGGKSTGDPALHRERVGRVKRFKSSGKWLDVGCGSGRDMDAIASLGYASYGVELSSSRLRQYQEKGHRVHIGDIGDLAAGSEPEQFDVISLWDVLEHLENPGEALRAARHLLKQDGLLVLKVPNHASVTRLLHGPRWDMYHPGHLYYFTPATLRALLARHRLRIRHAYSSNPHGKWLKPFNPILLRALKGNFLVVYAQKTP